MSIKKYSQGQIIPDPKEIQKTQGRQWTDQDEKELEEEDQR